ncbi:MAG: DEAD/DEAH box helicase [Lachnospiraceae bacterium]|nr:DEAD/DEAH box helicase [Lachnospiraceae bacterium]
MEDQTAAFTDYGLTSDILESLQILGYMEPTRIQQSVIPAVLSGRDVVGRSQTGSGKTAAFGIPLCQLADWSENKPQAIVLEPTRELTVQVKEELYHIGRKKRLKIPDVFGGFPIDKQIQTLKQKSHIVVGTPGRVMDHVRRGSLDLSKIKRVVIDEADLMLDMGFLEEVREILSHIPRERVLLLFSATLGEELHRLIQEYLREPIVIEIDESQEARADIRQELYHTSNEEKYELFLKLLEREDPDSCMIFCGTREMVNVLCRKLRRDGVKCGMIHGEIDQQDRIRTVEGFREGRFPYLIATDVVARGIDFQDLSLVFNYDFPTGRETYVHRIGRTGRNGKSGTAISLFTEEDQHMKEMIERYVGYELPVMTPEENREDTGKYWNTWERNEAFWKRQTDRPVLKERKGAGFQRTITRLSIGGGKKSKMRAVDIVGSICSIPDMTPEDIGAIDVRDSLTYVEILNGKGKKVLDALQGKTIKGKLRKVRETRNI